jgi:hypothetical protein
MPIDNFLRSLIEGGEETMEEVLGITKDTAKSARGSATNSSSSAIKAPKPEGGK